MYGSDSSRASSKYSSDTSRWLAKFNAQSASALSRQQHEQNMEYSGIYPSNEFQLVGSGVSKGLTSLFSTISSLVNGGKSGKFDSLSPGEKEAVLNALNNVFDSQSRRLSLLNLFGS